MTNEEAIEAKKKEVEHYIGVLERYGAGRWYDMGRQHLAELKEELRVLEQNVPSASSDERGAVNS